MVVVIVIVITTMTTTIGVRQMEWHTPVILALGRKKQEDVEFKASSIFVRLCHKTMCHWAGDTCL